MRLFRPLQLDVLDLIVVDWDHRRHRRAVGRRRIRYWRFTAIRAAGSVTVSLLE